MKKSFLIYLCLLLCLTFASAHAEFQIPTIDLTSLSSTFVYSEVYNMMMTPEDYLGTLVKMKGEFSVAEGENRNYYACVIADAAACCAQGIEFVLTGDPVYPQDYPEPGCEIVVEGIFDLYEEDGYLYVQLINARLINS